MMISYSLAHTPQIKYIDVTQYLGARGRLGSVESDGQNGSISLEESVLLLTKQNCNWSNPFPEKYPMKAQVWIHEFIKSDVNYKII